jgi:dienelactone hydrolase/uncharacterized protein YndB with AHSA1/START domain
MIPILLIAVLFSAAESPAAPVVERDITVAASPLQVYNAFAVDWQVRQCNGAAVVTADARPGGGWRWTFSPDSLEEGVFESAERAVRLVFTHIIRGEDTRVTLEIIPAADSTRLHLSIVLPDAGETAEILRQSAENFWSRMIPRLADYLNRFPGGYLVKPFDAGPHPAVLVLHDRFGLNRTVRALCDSLAKAGYTVLAADMFRGEVTADQTQAARFVELVKSEDALNAARRALACLQQDTTVQANRIAVWSLDFGTTAALNLAAQEPRLRGVVVWQGGILPEPDTLRRVAAPVLAIFADADVNRPRVEITVFSQKMAQAGVRNEIAILMGNRDFSDPAYGSAYSASVTDESWRRTLRFLDRQLRVR